MQTVKFEVRVADAYMDSFFNMLNSLQDVVVDNIETIKDKNLQFDPYFYERKRKLDKIISDMDKGIGVLSHKEVWDEIEKMIEEG